VVLGGLNPVVPDNEPEIAASEAISQVSGAYGQCPKCNGYRYTQRRAPTAQG